MKDYLTTGQMIDALQYGQIAVGVEGFFEGTEVVKTLRFGLRIVDLSDKRKADEPFIISDIAFSAKWKIMSHPLMTDKVCVNCKFKELYGEHCPVDDEDDTEHLDDGLMISCKRFVPTESTQAV